MAPFFNHSCSQVLSLLDSKLGCRGAVVVLTAQKPSATSEVSSPFCLPACGWAAPCISTILGLRRVGADAVLGLSRGVRFGSVTTTSEPPKETAVFCVGDVGSSAPGDAARYVKKAEHDGTRHNKNLDIWSPQEPGRPSLTVSQSESCPLMDSVLGRPSCIHLHDQSPNLKNSLCMDEIIPAKLPGDRLDTRFQGSP